jgi:hypothetical protein
LLSSGVSAAWWHPTSYSPSHRETDWAVCYSIRHIHQIWHSTIFTFSGR